MPKVLLTFVGFHDPHYKGAVEGEELKGPILYLLGLRSFDRVFLLTGANTLLIARATATAIAHDHPGVDAQVIQVDLDDPISYRQIIAGVRKAFRRIDAGARGAEYFISTASGTPQMHAAWLLLASSGEIPAVVLQTRPPQYVTTERHAVEAIDLRKAGMVEPSASVLRSEMVLFRKDFEPAARSCGSPYIPGGRLARGRPRGKRGGSGEARARWSLCRGTAAQRAGDRGQAPRLPAGPREGNPVRPIGHAGPDPGRDGHGQGAGGPLHPPAERPARREDPRPQLRVAPAGAVREPALRPPQGLLHGRHRGPEGRLRACQRRHPVPRRDRRASPRDAGQDPARSTRWHGAAPGRPPGEEGHRPPGGSHQPRPRGHGQSKDLPRGPVLPHRGGHHPAAAPARAAEATSRSLPSRASRTPTSGSAVPGSSRRRRSWPSLLASGRATCAA